MKDIKSLGDAIGMPTEADKAFIRNLILEYDRQHPGQIKAYRDDGKRDLAVNGAFNGRQEFGVTGKQAHMRMIFNFPPGLAEAISQQYPTIFREKVHFRWFVKHFRELMTAEKY